jgi:succinate dehydrogenase hydrophobic anchor subunit
MLVEQPETTMRLEQRKYMKKVICWDMAMWLVISTLLIGGWVSMITTGVMMLVLLGIALVLVVKWESYQELAYRHRNRCSWLGVAWAVLDSAVILAILYHAKIPLEFSISIAVGYMFLIGVTLQFQIPKKEIHD